MDGDGRDWVEMARCRQELQRLARTLLPVGRQELSGSECEILARLFLRPEGCTPLELSRANGMKQEAVSRCLRSLSRKGCVERERNPSDERSRIIRLTDHGSEELRRGLEPMLKPFYRLSRGMGGQFDEMFRLIEIANEVERREGQA